MKKIRERIPSPAMIVACLALTIALTGAGYAAVTLPRNSVGTAQLKRNAVTAKKIKAGNVTRGKIAANAVNGAKVQDGAIASVDVTDGSIASVDVTDGSLVESDLAAGLLAPQAYARVLADGTLQVGQFKGVEAADIQHNATATPAGDQTGDGVYCFGGLDFPVKSAVATLDGADSLPAGGTVTDPLTNKTVAVTVFRGEDLGRCDPTHNQVRVAITRVDETDQTTLVNHGFIIWFLQ